MTSCDMILADKVMKEIVSMVSKHSDFGNLVCLDKKDSIPTSETIFYGLEHTRKRLVISELNL